MVEPGDILPIGGDVAALAGAAQLALVHVLVAGGAIPAQTQVGMLQVLDQNVAALSGRNVLGIMALSALEVRVAPVQRIAGFPVTPFQWFDPSGLKGESFMNVPGTKPPRGS